MGALDALQLAAAAFAALTGAIAARCVSQALSSRRAARARAPARPAGFGVGGAHGACLGYLQGLTLRLSLRRTRPIAAGLPVARGKERFSRELVLAGLADAVSPEACCEARARLACAGACAGALLGCAVSNEMALAGLAAGAAAGFALPRRAVAAAARIRSSALERGLPEMLEVVALGVRSGLSFDRSMLLYTGHFDSALARECAAAQRSWTAGLSTRDAALRALAASYDSPILSRTVDAMVRSLRFGTSLGEVLEQAAAQARDLRKAKVEERVAKAPVKMMIPTGTLILPAMLLLVLGPVLLELMKGV